MLSIFLQVLVKGSDTVDYFPILFQLLIAATLFGLALYFLRRVVKEIPNTGDVSDEVSESHDAGSGHPDLTRSFMMTSILVLLVGFSFFLFLYAIDLHGNETKVFLAVLIFILLLVCGGVYVWKKTRSDVE